MKSPKRGKKGAAPGPAKPKKGNNLVDPEQKRLFVVHRDKYADLKAKADKASATLRGYVKTITSDGFSLMQIKDAIRCSTPEGEQEFKAELANRLLAAAYADADVGEQLSLFLDEVRVPAVDRAYKEGQTASMENRAAVPPYDPSTEQFRAYMKGFHEEQERIVKAGIKKADGKPDEAKGGKKRGRPAKPKGPNAEPPAGSERKLITKAEKEAKAAAKAPKDAGPPRRAAAEPVTRASVRQQREAAKEEAESYFTLSDKLN